MCEIGGGYGAPARVWFDSPIFQPKRYIIIDLCESLYFSEVYLRSELPNCQIIHLSCDKIENLNASKQQIILCPLENIGEVISTNIDLFINTLSMQEMSEEWVNYYMNIIDQSNANYFYSFNSLGRPLNNMHEVTNLYSPCPSAEWFARSLSYPYGTHGDAAEIIYERIDEAQEVLEQRAIDVFERSLERGIANRQYYAHAVDSLRFISDNRFLFRFVQAATMLDPVPREVLHFCGILTKCEQFDPGEVMQIKDWEKYLSQIRASGTEAVVHDFAE